VARAGDAGCGAGGLPLQLRVSYVYDFALTQTLPVMRTRAHRTPLLHSVGTWHSRELDYLSLRGTYHRAAGSTFCSCRRRAQHLTTIIVSWNKTDQIDRGVAVAFPTGMPQPSPRPHGHHTLVDHANTAPICDIVGYKVRMAERLTCLTWSAAPFSPHTLPRGFCLVFRRLARPPSIA